MLMSKEHYELMEQFERQSKGSRLDKEPKENWPRGYVYQDGHVNEAFVGFRKGYAYGKSVARLESCPDCDARSKAAPSTEESSAVAMAADAAAFLAQLEAAQNKADRYEWVRTNTTGQRDRRGRQEFSLPDPHPLGNIMQGSVAQHLDAAIDAEIAALAEQQKGKPA